MKRSLGLTAFVFLIGMPLSNVNADVANVSPQDIAYLRDIAKETWHCMDSMISPATGLPYDSNQARDITNTTNIGLYLAALSMAYKMGYLSETDAVARAQKVLDSLDRYENWHRLYSNWLDPDGKSLKGKPGESNISDYNKLPAGIVVVRQTFTSLTSRCTAFLDDIPWEKFHEAGSDKICYAFDVGQQRVFSPVYYFGGEDKLLGHFLMIASGKVPASSWERHNLVEEEREGVRYYQYGWQGGGLFMHFICNLFLDNRGTKVGHSAANFAWAQIVHAHRIGAPVWGWSACVAPSGDYLGMGRITDEVVTPHASALAINLFPREVIDNLRRLEALGLRKPCMVNGKPEQYGFRDGVNWVTGEVTDKYLFLDQGMLFLALVNFSEDGLLSKTFGGDPMVVRGKAAIPEYRDATNHLAEESAYVRSLSVDDPGLFWLTEGTPAHCRPGQPIRKTLYARSLSSHSITNCAAEWDIHRGDGSVLHSGRDTADLRPHQTKKLIGLEIATDDARFGDSWTLQSLCIQGARTFTAHKESFVFYSYRDLAGLWRIAKGDDTNWIDSAFDDRGWMQAIVPMRWEDSAFPDYDGMAWYRLRFEVTPEDWSHWEGHPLAIALGAVDDADETYLNGKFIGRTGKFPPEKQTAYNTPRLYPVDRQILTNSNVIAVRVDDFGGNGGIWRGPVAVGPETELRQLLGIPETAPAAK